MAAKAAPPAAEPSRPRSPGRFTVTGIRVWPARSSLLGRWGWHWWVDTALVHDDGRSFPNPGVPEAYPWARSQAKAIGRAQRHAGKVLAEHLDLPIIVGER